MVNWYRTSQPPKRADKSPTSLRNPAAAAHSSRVTRSIVAGPMHAGSAAELSTLSKESGTLLTFALPSQWRPPKVERVASGPPSSLQLAVQSGEEGYLSFQHASASLGMRVIFLCRHLSVTAVFVQTIAAENHKKDGDALRFRSYTG